MRRNDHNVVVMVNADDLERLLQISTRGTYLTTHGKDEETLPLYMLLEGLNSDHAVHFIEGSGIDNLAVHICTSHHNHFTNVISYRRSGGFDNTDYFIVHSCADFYPSQAEEARSQDFFFMSGYYTSGSSRPRHFIPTDIRIKSQTEAGSGLAKLDHTNTSDVRTGLDFIANLIIAQQRGERPDTVLSQTKPACAHSPLSPSL